MSDDPTGPRVLADAALDQLFRTARTHNAFRGPVTDEQLHVLRRGVQDHLTGQGERRTTPSLMKTRNGVVPVALPSAARQAPLVHRMPPCTSTASNSIVL